MIEGALKFLIQTLGNLFAIAVLLRFMMQLFRVPFRNPFAQFIVAITDFAVKPLRRVVPGLFGLDWACLLLSLTIYLVIGLTLVRAVLSWVNSHTPLMPVVYELTEPFLRPLRRFVPMVSNVDLTPLVLFILCQLVLMVPVLALERALLGSL